MSMLEKMDDIALATKYRDHVNMAQEFGRELSKRGYFFTHRRIPMAFCDVSDIEIKKTVSV